MSRHPLPGRDVPRRRSRAPRPATCASPRKKRPSAPQRFAPTGLNCSGAAANAVDSQLLPMPIPEHASETARSKDDRACRIGPRLVRSLPDPQQLDDSPCTGRLLIAPCLSPQSIMSVVATPANPWLSPTRIHSCIIDYLNGAGFPTMSPALHSDLDTDTP
jgi:hypothetical protein